MIQTNKRRAKALSDADRKWLDVENTKIFNQFLKDFKAIRG